MRIEVTRYAGAAPEPAPVEPVASEGPPSSADWLAGLGIAGIGVGSGLGLKTLSLRSDAAAYCAGAACTDQRGVDLRSDARRYADASTVCFGVGIAALGAGLWLGFSPPSNRGPGETAAVPRVRVGPDGASLGGAW